VGKPIADHSTVTDRAEHGYACEEINLLPNGTVDVDKDVPGALIVTRGSERLLRASQLMIGKVALLVRIWSGPGVLSRCACGDAD
jgi:hypothetical protein